MKHEIEAFTRSKGLGMRPTFEPFELNDYMGVPREEDPKEYFHEKFMRDGRRHLSWYSSAISTAVSSLKDMFKNAFMSRFAAPDEDVCKPHNSSSACNAIESCSWCHGKNVTDGCRPLDNAKTLPYKAFHCSKISMEDKLNADKALRNEFADILSMEFYGDE